MPVTFSEHPHPFEWARVHPDDLTEFSAVINPGEMFVVKWVSEAHDDQRWRLYIESKKHSQRVFLHAHATLNAAKTAARTHLVTRAARK